MKNSIRSSQLLALGLAAWIPSLVSGAWWDAVATGVSTCSVPGYFVNPATCTKFYRCVDHSTPTRRLLVRYDFDCPFATVFDQRTRVCVPPKGGGCIGWSSGGGGGGSGGGSGGSGGGGWDGGKPSGGWTGGKPSGGWSGGKPPGGWGWTEGWVPGHGWYEGWGWVPGKNFWSFAPGRSIVIIYDNRAKRSLP